MDVAARERELDGYEGRFGKYFNEHGTFGKPALRVGVQSFALDWDDDPELTDAENAAHRRWFKRMLCCALHHLVEEQVHLKEADQ